MNVLTRTLIKRLSHAARPYLKRTGLLQTSGVYGRSAIEWRPGAERVLVLAPHMDDEVIGCGGTLALHVERGSQITVAFLTDGRGGGADIATLSGDARHAAEQQLIAVRKAEAHRALSTLGIRDLVFIDAPDGALAASDDAITKLRKLVHAIKPDIVYLPSFLEEHVDHRATTAVLASAVAASEQRFQCFAYEVWTPLVPNCLVRIDSTIDAKKKALAEYRSQLEQADYMHACIGLNAHRSIGLHDARGGYAEAFFAAPWTTYADHYRHFCAQAA